LAVLPLQVELAQTEYQLPRLTRMWSHLDRVAGGGQVKGTGEKQIEIDKRLLRDKAAALRRYGGVMQVALCR
jgi:GTP-binding protein HflX